jgi:hypothetical protein
MPREHQLPSMTTRTGPHSAITPYIDQENKNDTTCCIFWLVSPLRERLLALQASVLRVNVTFPAVLSPSVHFRSVK